MSLSSPRVLNTVKCKLCNVSSQYISHNYAEQSTSEDPRMMAFFDSLVQRELECLGEESDSCDGSSSAGTLLQRSDSSDSDHIVADFPPLPPKRGQLLLRLQRWKAGLANIEIVLASFSKSKYNNLIFKWGVINYSTLATHSFLLFNKNNNNIIRAFRDDAKQ